MKLKSLKWHIFFCLFGFAMVYPVLWWVGASFKSNDEIKTRSLFPDELKWENYIDGWFALPQYSFTHFYINTFELIFGVLIVTLVSCSLVAFGFARLDFPLRNFWFAVLLVTMMLPSQVLLVPQYVLFNFFGWVNSYKPFYIPHALGQGVGGPFFIFLIVQFIRGIPKDLDESAKIDGCSYFGIYWRIILPLIKPALVTVGIYCFLWNWDDFLGHLIYINSMDKFTVSLALRLFVDSQSAVAWGQLLAMSLLSIIPATIVYLMAQKHFVQGIASTGIKG